MSSHLISPSKYAISILTGTSNSENNSNLLWYSLFSLCVTCYMLTTYSLDLTKRLQKTLCQTLILATITSASLISGTFGLNSKVAAQTTNISNTELTNYAKALLDMEPSRQQAFTDIKNIVGSQDIPQIVCNDSKSFATLPNKAKNIAVNYCNSSQKIVENSGFTIKQFNKITLDLQNNSDLKRQLYNILLRLQKNSPSEPPQ
jgi:hypothetical protein